MKAGIGKAGVETVAQKHDIVRQIYDRDGVALLHQIIDFALVEELSLSLTTELIKAKGVINQASGFYTKSNLWRHNPAFLALAQNVDLVAIVAAVLARPSIYLYEDTFLVKEPGCQRRTPWHQDQPHYAVGDAPVCTVWISLDVVTEQSGALQYVVGSHRWKRRFRQPASFRTDQGGSINRQEISIPEFLADSSGLEQRSFSCQPGDGLLHHGLTIHGANANRTTDIRRRAVALSYFGVKQGRSNLSLDDKLLVWSTTSAAGNATRRIATKTHTL